MLNALKTNIWTVAALLAALVYCLIEAQGEGDFYIFISASGWLDEHINIYARKYLDSYNYYYSVLFALVLKPFYKLPFFGVKCGWLLLNLFLYYRLFTLLKNAPVLEALGKAQKKLFLLAVFLFSFRFLHQNIHASQITILILWCCVYGLYWIHSGKTLRGSAVLALGINIKLLPLVFLPYLIYRGYFRAFFITLGLYLLSLFLPGLIIGNAYNLELIQGWLRLINPTNEEHVMDVAERSFHSLTTLLTTLLVENPPDPYAMHLRRHIADVPLKTLSHILLGARLALIAFTLYFLKLRSFAEPVPLLRRCTEISYILLLIPLIFPHQQHYAFLFITPAFAVVLFTLLRDYNELPAIQRTVLISALALSYLAANLMILLGAFNHYYEHYKLLTYGALLLIPLLVWASRTNARVTAPAANFN